MMVSPVKGLVNSVGQLFKKPKAPALPAPQPIATRDDAIAQEQADDAMRRRRGTAANLLLGPQGAEAASSATATKLLTGQ